MAGMTYRLSVLDQSPIAARVSDAAQALRNTLDLAQTADALGYHRYWLAEHHASRSLAGVAPEALIGPVALATSRIRVGSGGIMLPHYSPFKVAETFSLLSALAPGRIDLGLGRAPGSDQRTAFALQRDRSKRMPSDFPEQLDELTAYLEGDDAGGSSVRRAAGPDADRRRHARIVDARLLARQRACGRPSAACLIASPTSSIRTARISRSIIAAASALRRGWPSLM